MPTTEFPPPAAITPDNTTAFPSAYTGPIVVPVDVDAYYTDDDTINLSTDAAILGITVGMLVSGFGIGEGTEVTAISGNAVETSLTFNETGDGSDLTFSMPIETTEFPPVVEPTALPTGTPPTPGNAVVWGPNSSLADGGVNTGFQLHLGDFYPDADMVVEMEINSTDANAVCELALQNGTVNGEAIVGWTVVDNTFPPGTTVISVEEGTIEFSAVSFGDAVTPVRLAETVRGTIVVHGLMPTYDPTIHDLKLTVSLASTIWEYHTGGLAILLPLPSGAAERRVDIQVTAGIYEGPSDLGMVVMTETNLDIIFDTKIAQGYDTGSALTIPLDTRQPVGCLLRPNIYSNYELLQRRAALPFVAMIDGRATDLSIDGGYFTGSTMDGGELYGPVVYNGTFTNGTFTNGTFSGALAGKPQTSITASYTLVLGDAGKHLYHPAADTTARTWTIPANASVAFAIGTIIVIDNDYGAGALTIAITTDTLVLAGAAGTTGSRTLASGGRAELLKVTATRWRIANIVGLT